MSAHVTSTGLPAYEVIVIHPHATPDWERLRQQCYDLRVAVFIHEQGFPLDVEFEETDDSAETAHILLRLVPSLTPIGTIRGHRPPGKGYYKLSRLVVLQEYRKHRLGGELVLALHEWVKQHYYRQTPSPTRVASSSPDVDTKAEATLPVNNFIDVVTHSQIPVKGFYTRYGYEPAGAEFDEDGAPHQKMVARLEL